MVDPIAVGQILEYTLKNDTADPTIWLIGPLDSITKARIISKLGKIEMKNGEAVYSQGEIDFTMNNFTIVKYGLKGVKNWKSNGEDVKFETAVENGLTIVADETLKKIPLYAIAELANVIWGENQVNEELRKN